MHYRPSVFRRGLLRLSALDRTSRLILLITLAGFTLRLVWVVVATRPPQGVHDPAFYLAYADRIAQGRGYTTPAGEATAYYPVGYPAVLAFALWIVRRLPGSHVLWAATGLNVIAGTITVGLMGVLSRRLLGNRAAVATASAVAALPSLVLYSATVLSETVFVTLVAGALLVLCWKPWQEPWSGRRVVTAAVLVAVAALVRPVALVLVPVVVGAWLFSERRRLAPAVRRSALFIAVLLLVLTPWLVRTWSVAGRLTLAASVGDNLCIGNNPQATGAFALPAFCFDGLKRELFITGTDDRDRELTAKAAGWALSHVAEQASLVLWRTFYTFENDQDAVRAVESYGDDPWLEPRHRQLLRSLSDAVYFSLLGLAILGTVQMSRMRSFDPRRAFLLATAVGFVVVVWPFFGDPRFHVPVVVLLAVPAGAALDAAWGARR